MKKTYIAPKANIIDIKMESCIMANSNISMSSLEYNDSEFSLNEGSSRSNLWGED